MNKMHPPLDDELVGMVMVKLALTYGRRFSGGYDADPATVRAHWAHELAGISEEGIRYALSRLPPDFVPNVLQFRSIACSRPDDAPRLPAPQASPEQRERAVGALRTLRDSLTLKDGGAIAWAERVLNKPDATYHARRMARDVLRRRSTP